MFFKNYFTLLSEKITSVDSNFLHEASKKILALRGDNKIIIVGNGGSANIASHMAVDFTNACKIPAITFSEQGLITCFSNDYGFENWVSKALEAYAKEGDLIILISSSGESQNIINAAKTAQQKGLDIITFSGFKKNNRLSSLGQQNFWVGSSDYNIVEMTHHIWLVAIAENIILTNTVQES